MLDFSQDLSAQTPLVHPTSRIQNCTLGRYVEIGDRCVLEETAVGDYTYCFGSNDVIYTTLGMFLIEKAKETGEFDEALEFNRKAMEYDDEDASTLDNMGQLYLLMAEHERKTGGEKAAEYRAAGADYIRRAYEAKPDQMTSAYYRAMLLHEDGDDAAARKILDDTKDVTVTALCPVSRAQLDALRREL